MAFDTMPDLGPLLMPGAAAYAERCLELARAAAPAHAVTWDVRYGPDPFQSLDVWAPRRAAAAPLPVVVFWHGGGLRHGHKEWIGAMAPAVCALPALLVAPDHRLVPRVRVVDQLADCLDAVAWVHRHAASHGGDPSRIILAGHSAGGYLAALAALSRAGLAGRGVPATVVRGVLSLGGMFTMRREDIVPEDLLRTRFRDEMVASEAEAEQVTAFALLAGNRVPLHLAWAERDIPFLVPENRRLAEAAREAGVLAGTLELPGTDHFTAHLAAMEAGSSWMAALAEAVRR